MGRFVLIVLLITSAATASAQALQDVRIVTADDPPYVQTENGRLLGGLVVAKLYRVLDKLGIPRNRIQVLPWSRALHEARTKPGTLIFPKRWLKPSGKLLRIRAGTAWCRYNKAGHRAGFVLG